MTDCRHLRDGRCELRLFGGSPKPSQCLRCTEREHAKRPSGGSQRAAPPRARGFDIMLGGAWFDHPLEACAGCESKRRFARDWFAEHDDEAGDVAGHAAD